MKNVCICMLTGAVLLIGGCANGDGHYRAGYDFSKIDKVAVIDVIGDVRGDAAKNQIGDFFAIQLLRMGFTPVERTQVQSLLKEQSFQMTDVTSTEQIAQAGKILNVPTVLIVNIPEFAEEINITAKMLDVEDGSILWASSGSGRTGKTLGTIAGAVVGAVAGATIAGEDSETLGGVAGGVLGGVAGQALAPQEARQAQKIIKKMCESMPQRFANK